MSSSTTYTLPDGRVISYKISIPQQTSEGPLTPVLLSNSLAAPYASWDRVVRVLVEQGYPVLQYDQPGHGETSAPSDLDVTTFISMADDVAALLQGLNVSKLKAWIGVSMGAAKGVFFAVKYPGVVENLIICDTISSCPKLAGVDDVFEPRAQKALEEGDMKSMVDATFTRWFSETWRRENPQEAERIKNVMMGTKVEGFVTCIRALQSETFDLRPLALKVGGAVDDALVIVGELDANLPQTMDTLRNQIQEGFRSIGKSNQVGLKIIKKAGHVSYIDGFEEFCQAVTEFLGNGSSLGSTKGDSIEFIVGEGTSAKI